jgi:hypothetical protein
MAKKLIKTYVFEPGLGLNDNARPNAVSILTDNKIFIVKEAVAYVQNQVTASNPDYTAITYNYTELETQVTAVVDALIFDLQYNGNEETRRIAGTYWGETVSQLRGNRVAETESLTHIRDLINTYVLQNTLDPSPEQVAATQTTTELTAEANTTTRVTTLLDNIVDVIDNGLLNLPTLEVGLGRIEILGKISLEDILIITNVTDNTVIYNFAEPTKGGQTRFSSGHSEAYPRAEQVNEGTTIVNFKFSTDGMSSTDEIQIFFEESELQVRLNEIALDAMERVKIGKPQAMLDADFEYGLQPTKWQAIGTLRGYPSTYEIPASELSVKSVVSDGSISTGEIGASLITVTTTAPHGLAIGDVITIRALSSSIAGFNRAEGTFIVQTIPSTTSFTYYAKSKVGSNGSVLATTNTQLRKGGFYTGAALPDPTITVASQGGSGNITTTLRAPSGDTNISFSGTAPPIGVPLSDSSIPTGTQVTAVYGATNVSGVVTTEYVKNDFTTGSSSISVSDTSLITAGMLLNTQDGSNTQSVITSVEGDTLTLSRPVQTSYIGDDQTFANIALSSNNYIVGTGTGATFDVVASDPGDGLAYTSVAVNAGGSNYQQGDTLRILGSNLGGTDTTNDIIVTVDTVVGGSITAFRVINSTTPAGSGSFTGVASSQIANPNISNAAVQVTRSGGSYVATSVASTGTGVYTGNRFLISGENLSGGSPTNDLTITITVEQTDEINTILGGVNTFTVSGTAVRGNQIDIYAGVGISAATTGDIAVAANIPYSAIATINVQFSSPHGLVPGATILADITTTGTNHDLATGPFFIQEIVDATNIRYQARSAGTIDTATETLRGNIYIRPDAFFTHRPFDGGVQLGTGGPQHGAHAIRMSKKYIRYQSGKGAMYNTGALFAPSFNVASITSTGTSTESTITITTDDVDHGLQSGATVRLTGVETVGYNGDYVVNQILDERRFTVNAQNILGSTTATIGFDCQVALYKWHGAVVRSGCFDDQNGIFWAYDGNQLYVGRRSSTYQLAGTLAVNVDSNSVTGTNTRFLDQLQEGDRIVIKGMTHVVSSITNNTSMTITPAFRGVTSISATKAAKVQDLLIPQSEWNLDKCDGTGPSGYEIDITKMQMIGVQFTWYGAGFIDWMLRGPDGNYIFCHRLKGNNLNTEAYMRTGNLPVRYEVLNEGARSRLNGAIDASQNTITLKDASEFPTNGTVYIGNEVITYTGKSGNTLTGCTRGSSLQNFAGGSTRTYTGIDATTHADKEGVVLISCTTSPIISHWGSAYLIDGEFDNDRGYIFSYPETNIEINTVKKTAFMLRLAPSVSNAIIGDLGERELLNRAQLLLSSLEITSDGIDGSNNQITGGIVVEGVINPGNYPANPGDVAWQSLSTLAQGGQPSFAQVAAGGGINWTGGATQITANVNWQGNMSVTGITNSFEVDARGTNRDDYVWVLDTTIQSQGLREGMICNTTPFNGRRVTRIGALDTQFGDRQLFFDNRATNEGIDYSTGALSLSFTYPTEQAKTQRAFFSKTSWDSSGGVTIGTSVDVSDTNWPAGTIVSTVEEKNFGSTNYVEVQFNNASNTTLNGTAPDTVTFTLGASAYGQPGETVFSLIAQPGELASVDLSELKELTTTTLGGRGAFPNGPDVLAINVYKVSGVATTGNILLRWGEAQA